MSTHTLSTFLGSLIVALVLSGCNTSDSATVPGTYRGLYFGCSEAIVINRNGFFTQTLAYSSASFTNTGSWKFEVQRAQQKVVFSPFLVAVDTRNAISFNPPERFSLYDGDWIPDRGRIEFRAEARYFVERGDR